MISDKHKKYSLIIALFQLFTGLFIAGLWIKYQGVFDTSFLLQVLNTLIVGFLISLLSWRHNVMAWRSFVEKRENEVSSKGKNIFQENVGFEGRFEKAFLQFNKVLLPLVLLLISIIEFYLCLRIYWLPEVELVKGKATLLIPVAVLFSFSLITFLSGKFASGLAHNEDHVYLRPVCGYLLYNSITMFMAALAALLYHFEITQPLGWFVNVSIAFSCIIALERVLLWIVDMYRPKSQSEEYLPIYESRFLALFSQPKGVFGNLAAMLEYQFGIKVSESLFAAFSKKVLLPYLSIQFISLFLLSSITYIKPHEKALKMSWGDKEFTVLEPGLYLTAPWPIASVERFDVYRVKEIYLTNNDDFEAKVSESKQKAIVDTWDREEYSELLNLTAKLDEDKDFSQNLAVLNVKMSYRIKDVLKFRSAYMQSQDALGMTGKQVLSRTLLESDFESILGSGLKGFYKDVKKNLSESCETEFGVEVVDISIVNFQPPPQIAPSYQSVHIAREDRDRLVIEAQKFSNLLIDKAELEYDQIVKKAENENILKKKLLDKELESFEYQRKVYYKMPLLFKSFAELLITENTFKDVPKFINLTGAQNKELDLDLKKLTPDLLELE